MHQHPKLNASHCTHHCPTLRLTLALNLKVVELSGEALGLGRQVGSYRYWFVLHYDMATSQAAHLAVSLFFCLRHMLLCMVLVDGDDNGVRVWQCQLAPLHPDGRFSASGDRAGRTRWKAALLYRPMRSINVGGSEHVGGRLCQKGKARRFM